MLPSFFFFLLTRSVQKNIFMITWLSDFLHFIFENWVPQWVSSSIFIFRLDTPTWCTLGWKVLWRGINNLSVFLIDIAFSLNVYGLKGFLLFLSEKQMNSEFCKKCWNQLLQVILFEINCAIFYTNLHELFCQFISWTG